MMTKTKRRVLRGLFMLMLCMGTVAMLEADGNACCGPEGGSCDCGSCDNNWECNGQILGELSGCCGMGDGRVACNYNADATNCGFCTQCESGSRRHCGYCDEPLELE